MVFLVVFSISDQFRPSQTNSQLRPNCEMTRELTEAILAEVPEAEIEAIEGDEGILSAGPFLPFFWGDEGEGFVRWK